MATRETINFAVVGLGIGQSHIRAIEAVPDAKLVAICSTDEEALHKTAERTGVDAYADYQQVLARPDVDVVTIGLPSGMHADFGIAAARAGKHVLCEKPLDITLEKADALIAACHQAGVKLAAVFQNRFSPVTQVIKAAIDSGRLGRIVYADAHLYWYRAQSYFDGGDPKGWHGTWALDGGGAVMNQGIHNIDLIQHLAGPVKSVFARSGTYAHKIETEDVATAVLNFESGALGNMTFTTSAYPGLTNDLHIVGENGIIAIQDSRLAVWKIKGESKEAEAAEEQRMLAGYSAGSPNPAFDPKMVGGHIPHIKDIIQAIREDKEPVLNGEGARPALALALAILESAASRKEVAVRK